MIAYDQWANRRTLASILGAPEVPARVKLWFPHIVGAQREWLARIEAKKSDFRIWPDWPVDRYEPELDSLYAAWGACLDSIRDAGLGSIVTYQNSEGESFSNTVGDVIQHVLLHSHYHRGQIAAEIRASKGTPAVSDFIFALRDPDFRCD